MACLLRSPPPVSAATTLSTSARNGIRTAAPPLADGSKRAFNYMGFRRFPKKSLGHVLSCSAVFHMLSNNLKCSPYLKKNRRLVVSARQGESTDGGINFSVLRFTLGIPGLDESYLPRYLGLGFGFLIIINHLFGSDSPTPAQLRSEALGIFLAAFSITLPYFGTFLKGASPVDRSIIPEGNRQIFAITEDTPEAWKEDFAWSSYIILQNTNTISVLISSGDKLCIRGYWNVPEDASKAQILDSFRMQIRETGLTRIEESIYFPLGSDSQFLGILPKGALSVLLQPTHEGDVEGFILLASSATYAYRDSDRAWIRAVANKFRGMNDVRNRAFIAEISS